MLRLMMVAFLCCSCVAARKLGEERPDARLVQAQADFDEAMKLRSAGKAPEALERAKSALMLRQAVLGESHPEVAKCLTLMGDLYRRQGDTPQAETLFQRALELRRAALGPNHPDVASSLNNLALIYEDQGSYAKAEPLLLRSLSIREATLGPNHPDVALSLNNLAILYKTQGLYAKAEPLLLRALSIQEALGSNPPDVALSLTSLANLYREQGLYAKAEPLLLRALPIYEAALGPNHLKIASSLNNLAALYVDQGLYAKAEPLLLRALPIYEAALGPNHPNVVHALNNLALLYLQQGFYEKAEPLFQRALSIRESTLGPNHPDVANSLNSLTLIYLEQGSYEKAEPLLLRALSIKEAALGPNHPDVALSLLNLAMIYLEQGLYEKAEPLLLRALSIYEAALGPNHPNVATSLHYLALLYKEQGLYAKAEPLFQRALSIREAALSPNHPDVAQSLGSLADIYKEQGLYDKAELFYQRALSTSQVDSGPINPAVAYALNRLALLDLGQHRLTPALPLLTRALSISERRLRQEALDFSESRLSSFLHSLRQTELNSYAPVHAYPQDAGARHLALSAALLLKGRSLAETSNVSRALYQGLDSSDRLPLERLRSLRTQLASLSFSGPGSLSLSVYQQRFKTLTDEGDSLEADLARRSAPLRSRTALPPVDSIVETVASSLPHDGALIEFVAYEADRSALHTPPRAASSPGRPGPLRYMALVLFPNASSQAVDLGPAEPIDRAALHLRDLLANRSSSFHATALEVYQLVFQPLLPLLGHTRRLLVSADGQLNLVPFAALHDGHGFLLDSFDFSYLNSGRELLPRPPPVLSPSSSVVVLADPDFSASSASRPPSSSDAARSDPASSAALERFFSTVRGDLSASTWASLPGTRQEALDIQHLLPQAQLFLGKDATKERLLHLSPPGLLHLATHGFFLADTSVSEGTRALGHSGELADLPLAVHGPEPLLRSGLVLSGASAQPSPTPTPAEPPLESSLVTALELAGLNLWGTQLVVLSACDTGRGDVRPGQGVYGLRRALVEAGAETVVMSLWKVKDDSTRLLMESYYRNLLAGQGRASALNEAMRSLKATQPHPHDWAPFIAVGSDAPLRAMAPATPPRPEDPDGSRSLSAP